MTTKGTGWGWQPMSRFRTIQVDPKDLRTLLQQAIGGKATAGAVDGWLPPAPADVKEPFCGRRRMMVASEDCRQQAQRCAQLAIAASAPSVAGALMMLALDYLAQSHALREHPAMQQPLVDSSAGFGD
jgi:hypothetical protein